MVGHETKDATSELISKRCVGKNFAKTIKESGLESSSSTVLHRQHPMYPSFSSIVFWRKAF